MVTSPSGTGVILLGCYENKETIYEMTENENESGRYEWSRLNQKLKYPKSFSLAVQIPDHLTNCN